MKDRDYYLSLSYPVMYNYVFDSPDHLKYHVCAYIRDIPCVWAEGKDGADAKAHLEKVWEEVVDECLAAGVEPPAPPLDTSPSLRVT